MADDLRRRLRRAREAAGLSQNAAARETGLSLATIQNWESGRRANIGAADVAKAARAYGVSTDWLLGLTEEPGAVWSSSPGEAPPQGGPLDPHVLGPERSPSRGLRRAGGNG